MINLPQGFRVGAPEAVDARLALTFSEMVSTNDNIMPQVYFTICKDDSNIYIYNKENESDEKTGKFRLYSSSNEEPPIIIDDSEPIDIEQIKTLFNKEEEEDNG